MKRVNVGSGKDYRESYLNVDVNSKFKPDIICDMRKIDFEAESIDEFLVQDCLDHITFEEAKQLLRKFFRWLKPKGILNIHIPNLDHLVYILRFHKEINLRHEALMWLYGSDGAGNTSYSTNIIRWAYNKESITKLLKNIGFNVIACRPDCAGFGLRVIGVKPEK